MTLFKVSSGLVQLSNMTDINWRDNNKNVHAFDSIPNANGKTLLTENDSVFDTLSFSGVTEDKAINIMLNSDVGG
jgi:hypothetical protein